MVRSGVDDQEVRERLLAAAADLFYSRGIAAVGMDDIRTASGVPLKRLYQCVPSKDRLVEAYLSRRDERWLAALALHVSRSRDPRQRVLAVFTFLAEWFATPDFRGCAFINAFGELGGRAGVAYPLPAKSGRPPPTARLMVDRSTPYSTASAACGTASRSTARVTSTRSVNTSSRGWPAPSARRRSRPRRSRRSDSRRACQGPASPATTWPRW